MHIQENLAYGNQQRADHFALKVSEDQSDLLSGYTRRQLFEQSAVDDPSGPLSFYVTTPFEYILKVQPTLVITNSLPYEAKFMVAQQQDCKVKIDYRKRFTETVDWSNRPTPCFFDDNQQILISSFILQGGEA